MDNENEIIPEVTQEEQIDQVVDNEEATTGELSVEAKLAKAQAEANKWRRIAEKSQKKTDTKPQITNDPQLSDELKLIARGLSDEEIEQAKVIAKGKGLNLTEAIKDPLFTVYQNNLKEEKKREAARLGASSGSGESQEELTIKPDMTREEHQQAFKKVMGL